MRKTSVRSAMVATLALISVAAMADPVQVTVNGSAVQFNAAQPQMIDGRVFVPLREVFEQLGATVDWDPSTGTVMADGNGRHIRLRLGSLDASVNGHVVTMDVAAQTYKDSTLVPLRFLGEALGANVDWQPQNDLVAITSRPDTERAQRIAPPPPPPPVVVPPPPPPKIIIQKVPTPVLIPAPAPPPPPLIISRDMVIPLRLDTSLTSNGSNAGDRFTATVRDGAGRYLNFPEGTVVEGRVVQATAASGSHGGTLEVRFTHIRFPDGDRYPIGGIVTRWDDKYITRTDAGRFVAKDSKEEAKAADASTGEGAMLLTRSLNGTEVGGSSLGGTFGSLIGAIDHGLARNVIFDQGTRLALILNNDLKVRNSDLSQ